MAGDAGRGPDRRGGPDRHSRTGSGAAAGAAAGRARRPSGRGLRSLLGEGSVARQVFMLQLLIVLLLVLAGLAALTFHQRSHDQEVAESRSLAVSEAFANAPGVLAALRSPVPTARLQQRSVAVSRRAGLTFVVVANRNGIRYTSPDRRGIGKRIVGDPWRKVRRGQVHTGLVTGRFGEVVRAIVPVRDEKGRVVGMVSSGLRVENFDSGRELPIFASGTAVALALAVAGTAWVSRRLRRQTNGLGPAEITRMYEHHDAVLHAVHEGVVIVDGDGRLLLANDEAARLLNLPSGAQGRPVTELGLEQRTAELLSSGRTATDEVLPAGERLLVVNNRLTGEHGGPPGSVATFRDSTELRLLSSRVDSARKRLQLLYEATGAIGTTLDVTRTADELAEFAVSQLADHVTVDLAEPVLRGDEPGSYGDSPQMLRVAFRSAATGAGEGDEAPEDRMPPLFAVGELIDFIHGSPQALSFAEERAVLIPRLVDSQDWRVHPERARRILDVGVHSLMTAPLQARGVVLGVVTLWRSEKPEPFEQDDLSLADELAARAAVSIDNARRYTREHSMAITLQRRLLPRALPTQSAVELASRYLPAEGGVSGDWFDVIPLPGTRVALVMGDVVGRGLHAAATMGRLRTAVHNFSTLDVPPDELLSHLDELVARIDQDSLAAGDEATITGATCLYAVYDPVSRMCVMARAGHPAPAVVSPDGRVEFPEVPAGPPLGVGGLPFETAELELEEGSTLVVYTDGLVRGPDRDVDSGLRALRDVLERSRPGAPEEICDEVVEALAADRRRDDVALMAARTRVLSPDRIADWDVDSDPAAVAEVRSAVSEQLSRWGLDDMAFTTELILSELITNAIQYAAGPVHVRLLRDWTLLVCEVSDHSSTSPHMRAAATMDEGGRGLFLVAQLADHWGTRYTRDGKVIWTEQSLPPENGDGEGGDGARWPVGL